MLRRKANPVKSAFLLLLMVFILLIITELVNTTYKDVINGYFQSNVDRYIYICVLQVLVFFVPAVIYAAVKHKKPVKELRLKGFNLKHIPFVIFVSLTTSMAIYFINYVFTLLIPAKNIVSLTMTFEYTNRDEFWAVFAAVVFVPAVAEELLMRGVILSELEPMGTVFAIFISALSFAAIHSSFNNLFGAILGGIVYGYITYKLDSIVPSILAHIINNTFALLLNNFIVKSNIQINPLSFFIATLLLFLLLIYITIKLLENIASSHKKPSERYVPAQPFYSCLQKSFNPYFIAFLFAWIIKSVFEYTRLK